LGSSGVLVLRWLKPVTEEFLAYASSRLHIRLIQEMG